MLPCTLFRERRKKMEHVYWDGWGLGLDPLFSFLAFANYARFARHCPCHGLSIFLPFVDLWKPNPIKLVIFWDSLKICNISSWNKGGGGVVKGRSEDLRQFIHFCRGKLNSNLNWNLNLGLNLNSPSFQECLMSFARRKNADRVVSSLQQGWWQSRRKPLLLWPVRGPGWEKSEINTFPPSCIVKGGKKSLRLTKRLAPAFVLIKKLPTMDM